MLVEAAEVDAARVDRRRGEHGCRPSRSSRRGRRSSGSSARTLPVVRAQVEPAPRHRHVRAEPVVARLRVVEGQPLDRLLDHPHPPALFPARPPPACRGTRRRPGSRPPRPRPSGASGPAPPARKDHRFRPVPASTACTWPSARPRRRRPPRTSALPRAASPASNVHTGGPAAPRAPPGREPRSLAPGGAPAGCGRPARASSGTTPVSVRRRGVVDEANGPSLTSPPSSFGATVAIRLAREVHRRDRRLQGQLALRPPARAPGRTGLLSPSCVIVPDHAPARSAASEAAGVPCAAAPDAASATGDERERRRARSWSWIRCARAFQAGTDPGLPRFRTARVARGRATGRSRS